MYIYLFPKINKIPLRFGKSKLHILEITTTINWPFQTPRKSPKIKVENFPNSVCEKVHQMLCFALFNN